MPENEVGQIVGHIKSARYAAWVSDTCCIYDEGDGVALVTWTDGGGLCTVKMPRAAALEAAHAILSCVRAMDRVVPPDRAAPRKGGSAAAQSMVLRVRREGARKYSRIRTLAP